MNESDAIPYLEQIASLEKRCDSLLKDNENMLWNLGGCSTFALGYGLDEPYSKDMARPALHDVYKLALKYQALEKENARLREVREVLLKTYKDICDASIASKPMNDYIDVQLISKTLSACEAGDIAAQIREGK